VFSLAAGCDPELLPMALADGTTLGPYVIRGALGAGGMGEVYRAHDSRLGRDVAVKVLPAAMSRDPERRERFQREARAIAAMNHPHICAIHDVGQQDGIDFLVMELLAGESLAARIARGALPFAEAAPIAHAMLETLAAVHERGIVHRDLKPANIFLTPHGVKLLDFGLARAAEEADVASTALTREGAVLGSPRYMAPEQLRGGPIDHRTDLFAAAVVIHEMLAGQPPFAGRSPIELAHAIVYDAPAPLPAGTATSRCETALLAALAKDPASRPVSARAFASALEDDSATTGSGVAPALSRRALTRIIVLPFRLLKADPDTDFLGFSLADAISTSLAGFDSIVVRSSLTAMQLAGVAPDLRALAEQAAVDLALTGWLLRVGSQVRVAAQLIEVPQGSLLWSHTIQAPVEDLFQLQDTLAHAIVSSLHVPLTSREQRGVRADVPSSAEGYELYLRANQLMMDSTRWPEARSLYERAVVCDPGYAPAWARLGRLLRVSSKYGGPNPEADLARAERAFERALALNPDLAMAHHFYTHLEVELGRAVDAMVRLLTRARARRHDADLFAALVTTCRYCGLLDESAAAYEHTRRLDPTARTSVAYTFYLQGAYDRALETDADLHSFVSILSRFRLGDRDRALTNLRELEEGAPYDTTRTLARAYRAAMEGGPDVREAARRLRASRFRDPEGVYLLAMYLCAAGELEDALTAVDDAVRGGFHCPSSMRADPQWAAAASSPEFNRVLALADAGHQRAKEAFEATGGADVLAQLP
jgi:TolB-like protein/tRNA A-37 threonylcarbamoyl transferase component Bud32